MSHPPAFFSRPSSSSLALRVSELCCCYSLIPFVESTAVMKLKSPLANSPAPTLFFEFILYTAAQCFCSKPSSGHTCDTAPPTLLCSRSPRYSSSFIPGQSPVRLLCPSHSGHFDIPQERSCFRALAPAAASARNGLRYLCSSSATATRPSFKSFGQRGSS